MIYPFLGETAQKDEMERKVQNIFDCPAYALIPYQVRKITAIEDVGGNLSLLQVSRPNSEPELSHVMIRM